MTHLMLVIMITLTSNIHQVIGPYIAGIENMKAGGNVHDTVMRTVATTMLGEMRTRIHERGQAADGGDIGQYSKRPTYISLNTNPGSKAKMGRPIGKTGKSKFTGGKKKGQDHSSRYFAGGYDEYKTAIGRNKIGKVNLSLSGQLQSQLNVIATSNGGYGLGWADDEKLRRAEALEKKYAKKIWALTDEEKEKAATAAKNAIRRALSE